MMSVTPVVRAAALALAAFAAAPLAAQAGTQQPAAKLEEWPALKDTEKDRVRALVGQFRKPDPALHEEAKKQLVAAGEAAVPILLPLVSDRGDNSNAALFAVLDQVLAPRHAALLARETKKPGVELRRYLASRLCRFGDPTLVGMFDTLTKDKDEATAFYAQLALLAQKRREALRPVLDYTKTRWKDVGELVAAVLTPARSRELGEMGFEAIAKANPVDQMAGLRLLRYLMVDEQGGLLRTYLEAADHTVKREAVNTARVLHGEAPADNLSVFQAIEQAKHWLQKI